MLFKDGSMTVTASLALTRRERGDGTVAHGWEAERSPAGELQISLFGDWVLATSVALRPDYFGGSARPRTRRRSLLMQADSELGMRS